MFNRLLIIGKSREVDLKNLLSYSLTSVPLSLGTGNGTICKTNKANLMHELEKGAECVPEIPWGSALIIDAMAFVQQAQNIPVTFGQLADKLLHELVGMTKKYGCSRVDFVCDRYPSHSIKNCERERRAVSGAQVVKITRPEQKTPKQFKKFLAEGSNKENLIEFLYESWVKCEPQVLGHIVLVISHKDQCHSVSVEEAKVVVNEVSDLFSDHEEADTRLLLHAIHAVRDSTTVVIKSPDTDVFVLSLAAAHEIPAADLLFLTGSGDNRRIICISKLAETLGKEKCRALLGFHTFTGCDSVSAFKGKGKVKPLDLLLKSDDFVTLFAELGTEWETSESVLPTTERFVCAMYDQKECSDVNVARYNLFRLTCKSDSQLLPPNQDCLLHHVKRANYQAAIHRRSLLPYINAPSPDGHGWKIEGDTLVFDWMSGDPAPPSVLKTVHCKCQKGGCKGACSCSKINLPCTDLCRCLPEICTNRKPESERASDSESDSGSDDDE